MVPYPKKTSEDAAVLLPVTVFVNKLKRPFFFRSLAGIIILRVYQKIFLVIQHS